MSYGPYPPINEVGIVTALREGFTADLRKPLPGLALAAGHELRFGRWFNEDIKWREVGGLKNVVLSMDLPPIQSDSGKTKKRTVESPIWTKDLEWGGRRAAQMAESGLDVQAIRERSVAMAEEMSRFVLLGATKDQFTGTADIKGLLNMPTVPATAGGDWNDPDVLNADLGKGHAELGKRRQGGPVTLLMSEGDSHVMNNFINAQSTRIGQNLPPFIRRVLYEEDTSIVPSGDAYLINDARRENYDIVSPVDEGGMTFGLGNINVVDPEADRNVRGTEIMKEDEIMKAKTVRFMNIMTIALNRDANSIGGDRTFVQKIDFTA